jgi:hypothetical protein
LIDFEKPYLSSSEEGKGSDGFQIQGVCFSFFIHIFAPKVESHFPALGRQRCTGILDLHEPNLYYPFEFSLPQQTGSVERIESRQVSYFHLHSAWVQDIQATAISEHQDTAMPNNISPPPKSLSELSKPVCFSKFTDNRAESILSTHADEERIEREIAQAEEELQSFDDGLE